MAQGSTHRYRIGERFRMSISNAFQRVADALRLPDQVDPLLDLRERYPDAPDEWLRLVANARTDATTTHDSERSAIRHDKKDAISTEERETVVPASKLPMRATAYPPKTTKQRVRLRFSRSTVDRTPAATRYDSREAPRRVHKEQNDGGFVEAAATTSASTKNDYNDGGRVEDVVETKTVHYSSKRRNRAQLPVFKRFPRADKSKNHSASINTQNSMMEPPGSRSGLRSNTRDRSERYDSLALYQRSGSFDRNHSTGYDSVDDADRDFEPADEEQWPTLMDTKRSDYESATAVTNDRISKIVRSQEARGWSGSRS